MSDGTITRRRFVKVSGLAGAGLTLGFRISHVGDLLAAPVRGAAAAASTFSPNAWLKIASDGVVTITVDEMEMGQGVMTSVPMIVAEELGADWASVHVEYGTTDPSGWPRRISTGGSTTIRAGWTPLRQAGAAAREMLLSAASERWGAPRAECRADGGRVIHDASGRELAFGDLVEAAAALPVPDDPPLKDPADFRIVGTSVPRVDTPGKVDGSARFGMDVQLPGMLVAVVARSPVFGGTVRSFDATAAEGMPGVRQVVQIDSGVAVVAADTWSAMKARDSLEVVWDEGAGGSLDTHRIEVDLAELGEGRGAVAREEGDPEGALATAARRVEAVYTLPYLAHACMEPMNCTAHVGPDGAELWVPTQGLSASQATAAEITGLPPSSVVVHAMLMGGGFGRRSSTDFVRDAVQVSKAVGAPVKVVWTREDDMRGGHYRPASYHRFQGALDESGRPTVWTHRVAAQSILSRFGPLRNGVDEDAVGGAAELPYAIPNLRVEYREAKFGIPIWWWRSVGHSHNGYVTECFVDELAAAAGADPLEFRRRLLRGHPRHLGVMELAAEKAGWGGALPEGHAHGLAVHESFGTFVAYVAEVSVAPDGAPRVHRVVAAVDCGRTINPNTVDAQIQSSIAYGLSAALYGRITVEGGRVQQSNFDDYPVVRMTEMPRVDVHRVESAEEPGGMGEAGLPPLAAAVVNGIFGAAGARVRSLPIDPQALRAG